MTRSTPWNRAGDAGQVPDRPQVRVEVERLAQPDVDAGEALADRRRHRSLQRDLVAADRVEQLGRQRLAGALERQRRRRRARSHSIETPAASRMRSDGLGDFGTDAVAGDERDGMCSHAGS